MPRLAWAVCHPQQRTKLSWRQIGALGAILAVELAIVVVCHGITVFLGGIKGYKPHGRYGRGNGR